MSHRHKSKTVKVTPFNGPIEVCKRPDPRSHGNITVKEVCACGCVRTSNVNGLFSERGAWYAQFEEA